MPKGLRLSEAPATSRRYSLSKRRIDPTEHQIQAAFIEMVRRNFHRYPVLQIAYAVPNAQKLLSLARRPGAMLRHLVDEGLVSGVPDWVLPWPSCGYNGLWIEFKARAYANPSTEQKRFHALLRDHGHRVEVMYDALAAWGLVVAYLTIK